MSQARSLVGSTLFGIAMTLGLHYYNGMITGVAIQTIMAPFNLAENALVKALIVGRGIREEDKIFEEKTAADLTADDQIVDDKGNPVVLRSLTPSDHRSRKSETTNASTTSAASTSAPLSPLENILLDTWDAGLQADLTALKASLTKQNCNFQTTEDRWTPLMIVAGLAVPGCTDVLRQLLELGADPTLTDQEGWTACHWAGFHGNVEAAKELISSPTAVMTSQLTVVDKEGNTPIETARKEKNDAVALLFEQALEDSKKTQ